MSTKSYQPKPYVINYVHYRYVIGGEMRASVHVNYEKTESEARKMCLKTIYWAKLSSFEITSVKTVTK